MLKAIIFDLDGVITDTAPLHYKAWNIVANELGLTIDKAINEDLKGLSRMDSLEFILQKHRMEDRYTKEEKVFLASKKNIYYQQLISTLTPEHILPGMLPLLKKIREHGYQVGLASASQNAMSILKALNIFYLFDVIADPTTIKKGKPAPDIYLLAAQALDVNPKNCIGIEDAISGVTSIKSANMFAIGIGDQKLLYQADLVVASTTELTFEKMMDAWNTY